MRTHALHTVRTKVQENTVRHAAHLALLVADAQDCGATPRERLHYQDY